MSGRPAGRASDIWSLGVTLHLALTGHGLFPALVSADPFTAVRIYLRSQPEPGEDLSDGERAVVVTAVHPDPARRYRTADELAEAVEEVARRPGGSPGHAARSGSRTAAGPLAWRPRERSPLEERVARTGPS